MLPPRHPNLTNHLSLSQQTIEGVTLTCADLTSNNELDQGKGVEIVDSEHGTILGKRGRLFQVAKTRWAIPFSVKDDSDVVDLDSSFTL